MTVSTFEATPLTETERAPSQPSVINTSAPVEGDDNLSLYLMLKRLEEQGPKIGDKTEDGATIIDQWVTQDRREAENITYGKDIEISAADFKNLGQDVDIVTYGLDESGHLLTHDLMDYNEDSVQHFMSKVDPVDGVQNLDQDFRLKMQRVEVDGQTVGFFIHGENSEHGTYMDASALQHFNLSEEKMAQLMQPETAEGPQLANRQPEVAANATMKL